MSDDIKSIMGILSQMNYIQGILSPSLKNQKFNKCNSYKLGSDKITDNDVIIHYVYDRSDFNDSIAALPNRKIMVCSNVGHSYDERFPSDLSKGKATVQISSIWQNYQAIVVYNEQAAQMLRNIGVPSDMINVLPKAICIDDFKCVPDFTKVSRFVDDKFNILFCGGILPNKKVEDMLLQAAYLKKKYKVDCRLILCGSYEKNCSYISWLRKYISKLSLNNVFFLDSFSFKQKCALMSIANVYVNMSDYSDHFDGITEAIYFKVPVISYKTPGLPEELLRSCIIINEKDDTASRLVAGLMNEIRINSSFRHKIIENQNSFLENYKYEKVLNDWLDFFWNTIEA